MTGPPLVPPGEHGGEGARLAAMLGRGPGDVLDLSQSVNPAAPDVATVVERHLDALGRYPDPTAATAALAEQMGVDADRLVLTNGGAEAIALVARRLTRGWVDEPDFSLYRRHIEALEPDAPRFRSNPHNPTGRLAAPTDEAGVWDEAFYPLATGEWTRGDADRGAWVVGSLTKLLACPGLRIGYVLAPSVAAAGAVRGDQPQWSVGGLACAALPELLEKADLPRWQAEIVDLRTELVRVLEQHGLAPRPSDANWVLVDAPDLRGHLAPQGIAVRDCASFGLPGVVRIAVPDEPGLRRLAAALSALR